VGAGGLFEGGSPRPRGPFGRAGGPDLEHGPAVDAVRVVREGTILDPHEPSADTVRSVQRGTAPGACRHVAEIAQDAQGRLERLATGRARPIVVRGSARGVAHSLWGAARSPTDGGYWSRYTLLVGSQAGAQTTRNSRSSVELAKIWCFSGGEIRIASPGRTTRSRPSTTIRPSPFRT
jgi:hypothetical protein